MTMRFLWAVIAVTVLATVYLFQSFNYALFFSVAFGGDGRAMHPYIVFVINKTLRLILNDLACMLLIFAIFQDQKYLRVALYVFLFELLVLLPAYFVIKLSLEGDSEISSPLLSQVHRLIVNPTLMILLMLGFFYQRFKAQSRE